MVGTSSTSSSSSSASLSSLDDISLKSNNGSTIKFLCSYGGKILPRYPDGKLRYVGGHTRVLSLDKSTPYSELQGKLKELCGWEQSAFSVRCQLPSDDLDALVSITSDEDLANLIEEYDLANREAASPLKIRTFLFQLVPPQSKPKSPASPPRTKTSVTATVSPLAAAKIQMPLVANCTTKVEKAETGATGQHVGLHRQNSNASTSTKPCNSYLVHNGNHWQ